MMAEVDVDILPDESSNDKQDISATVDVSKALSIVAISDKFWESLIQLDSDKRVMLTLMPNLVTFFQFWRKKAGADVEPGVQCTFPAIKSHWVKTGRIIMSVNGNVQFRIPDSSLPSPGKPQVEVVDTNQISVGEPAVKGFLLKRGHINTAFQMRWCELRLNTLSYRVDESAELLRGCINCTDCSIVSTPEIEEALGEHCFGLLTPFDKKHLCWILKASSHQAMDDWIDALKHCNGISENSERSTSLLLRPTELRKRNDKCVVC